MVAVPLTENNRSLAEAVNKRINADGVMLKAKASVWRLGGIGLMLMLIGFGIAAIMFGFSYINDDQALADRMATSFAKALEQVKVAVSGNVEMTPGTVSMPEPGKVVMNEPGKVVMERGVVEMTKPGEVIMKQPGVVKGTVETHQTEQQFRPTEQQLNPGGTLPNSKVVTNFTIFKFIPFGTGHIATGWDFSTSEQAVPTSQFCYYDPAPTADASQLTYLVRSNGKYTALATGSNGPTMLAQCQWFNGQAPAPR